MIANKTQKCIALAPACCCGRLEVTARNLLFRNSISFRLERRLADDGRDGLRQGHADRTRRIDNPRRAYPPPYNAEREAIFKEPRVERP